MASRAPKFHACVYKQENFQGPRKCFKVRTGTDLCNAQFGGCHGPWNDKIRSIQLGARVIEVKIYQHSKFGKYLATFTKSQTSLNAAQKGFTSIRVIQRVPPRKSVCIYTEPEFMGKRKCFGPGEEANLCDSKYGGCRGPWNDKIRSIQGVSKDNQILLYKHSKFDTLMPELTSATTNLANKWHAMTSLRVPHPRKACLYQRSHYQGNQKCFAIGKNVDLCSKVHGGCGGKWNDDVRSIYMGRAVDYVMTFKHAKFHSFLEVLKNSRKVLSPKLYGMTSSIVA